MIDTTQPDTNGAMIPQAAAARELSVASASAEATMTIQAAATMARQFPRNEDQVFGALMKSCTRPSFAEVAGYSFPRGGGIVKGPSIKLAREVKRLWGNIRTILEITYDEPGNGTVAVPGMRRIRGSAWDLQTNTSESFEDSFLKLHQRKVGKGHDRRTEWTVPDERDLRELTNRRGAICVRNAILALVPPDLVEDAMATADQTLEARAEQDPEGEKKRLIVAFSQLGIDPGMIGEHLGHPLGQSSPTEIAGLRQVWVSIRDGNSTWSDHLPSKPEANGAAVKPLTAGTLVAKPTAPTAEGLVAEIAAAEEGPFELPEADSRMLPLTSAGRRPGAKA